MLLSSALGYSPCLPVSVCGTDTNLVSRIEAFPGGASSHFVANGLVLPPGYSRRICLAATLEHSPPERLAPINRRLTFISASPHRTSWWCRNVRLLSIVYAFRPRLRIRLTLGGIA